MTQLSPASVLDRLARAAIASALPERLGAHLPPPPKGRTVVVGAGKAAAAMAEAFEAAWPHPASGVVVTRHGQGRALSRIRVHEAAHPVPDEASAAGARALLEAVARLGADDLVIALMSGGASSLITLPAEGLTLDDLKVVNRALLASGADIAAMNTVRKHLSGISGGRLAGAAFPAKVVTLAISDVPGDDRSVIGSGPTVPDASTRQEALAIVRRYGMQLPDAAMRHLETEACETPKSLPNADFRFIGRPIEALRAAKAEAERLGCKAVILGDAWEGEAREIAKAHAGLIRSILEQGEPFAAPIVLLSGGETTVTIRAKGGRGGRNSEFMLALALALDALPEAQRARVHALAIDTDGVDGSEQNAGARIGPDTLARARRAGLDAAAMLDGNDAFSFFAALNDLIVTGPTDTNVNDFRAMMIA